MASSIYNHKTIEKKWQKRWIEDGVFSATTPAPLLRKEGAASYILDMFPYPSGDGLHVGHPIGYIATDIYSRYLRMKGESVLHPMGWDAFGLPTENAAIKKGVHPRDVTKTNVANFKRQIQSLGFSYDWDREINTTDPKYYKWTQWIFLQLFKQGLAYEAELPIWWCPKDKTGLANEEVVDGACERCGTKVERKMLRQWVLKITKYADRLLDGLDKLDWPEGIKALQRNWIGKSVGAQIKFTLRGISDQADDKHAVEVYTTRPDTLFGATFLVISPELGQQWLNIGWKASDAVKKYIQTALTKSEVDRQDEGKEKTGVDSGIRAVHPATKEEIPVWVADYVLGGYGTGAIMAVPGHDIRDYEFAKKFGLEIRTVITTPAPLLEKEGADPVYTGDGELINSEAFDGMTSEEARKKITAKFGKAKVQYKLRDWVFSRQRYWGEPIPLVHCENCIKVVESTPHQIELKSRDEWDAWINEPQTITDPVMATAVSTDTKHKNHYVKVTLGTTVGYWRVRKVTKNSLTVKHVLPGIILVPDEELPLELPNIEKYEPTGTGESPLATIDKWVNVTCRVCGHPAKRETNTMPQWAGSCWYYLRFTDPENDKEFASEKAMKAWLPVSRYVGGAEHAVLHLLYARFWHKVLFDIGAIPKEVGDEPFAKLKNQGLILGPDGEKMSKSRGNVINPDDIIEQYGADTLRMYEMFMGPFEDAKPWDTNGIVGVRRFLESIVNYVQDLIDPEFRLYKASSKISFEEWSTGRHETNDATHRLLQRTIKGVTENINEFRFNTAVSTLMIFKNSFYREIDYEEHPGIKIFNGKMYGSILSKEDLGIFLKLLSPFAPHIAEELWQQLGHKTFLAHEQWPKFDPKKVKEETVTIAVQVMGKLRATLSLPSGSSQETVKIAAKAEPNVAKYLTGEPKKVVFVKDKLINFVV